MDIIMQTNVSAELWGSIYPLSNYINRSWIVTNGSRRGRRGTWRGAGEARDAWLHFSILFHSLPPPLAQIAPCAPFRNPPPTTPNLHTHTRTHTLTHWAFFQPKRLLCSLSFLALVHCGLNVGIMADVLRRPSYFCLAGLYRGCTQSLKQDKALSGPRETLPVNIAFTVNWMKEYAHCGHKLNAGFFFSFLDLSDEQIT